MNTGTLKFETSLGLSTYWLQILCFSHMGRQRLFKESIYSMGSI
jgi:hypothetical protein